ncbi:MAG: hypothetical protein WD696_02405 [Bryobacteraceae bacterium]
MLLAPVVAVTALLVTGCTESRLRPAPGANVLPGDPVTAVAETEGVRIAVRPNAWKGNPSDLGDYVTPLKVNLTNRSGRPLRVRYNEFTLVSPQNFRYAAIPPFRLEGSIGRTTLAPIDPYFGWSGFSVVPYYSPYYRFGMGTWGGPFAWDRGYYGSYYTTWRQPLPTSDMLEKAIPEGVLNSGGNLEGYLYFQKVEEQFPSVTFQADLMNADTEERFGAIQIPFVVR